MKKILATLLLTAFVLSCGGCNNGEASGEDLSFSESVSSSDDTAVTDETSAPETTATETTTPETITPETTTPETTVPETTAPEDDEPSYNPSVFEEYEDGSAELYGNHDLSNGNFVYNPNVTDTSNEARYYGDFGWTNESRTLWTSPFSKEKPWGEYDPDAAVEYGKAHWDDGVGLCAPFISRCLIAGGITDYTESSTSITLQLLHSGLGFGQFLEYNKDDHTITMPSYARPGDVVQIYCSYEGMMIHSLLMVGTDEEGKLKAVCHNLRNSGQNTFRIDYLNDPCYDCYSETVEVFFYHFYREDDENLPPEVENNKNILIWEEKGYFVQSDKYNPKAALDYAANNPEDGLGYYGASHTTGILSAGGITVGYPNQSALFLQLLKSHLGSALSVKVNPDRTVTLPDNAKPGDMCFIYCPYDAMILSSFIISGGDEDNKMIAHSYDYFNKGKDAFRVDSYCVGCGTNIEEAIIYSFDN